MYFCCTILGFTTMNGADIRLNESRNGNNELLCLPKQRWYNVYQEVICLETKDVIFELRTQKGLSQDELAEKIYVTRQAVSRWENGETIPNTETLKLLSKLFDVSINTLLGAPQKLICQCCGMPLDDSSISKETDGTFNEEYCKWCYTEGKFTYTNIDDLIHFCAEHMSNENWSSDQVQAYMKDMLPKLNYWKRMTAKKD